MMTTTEVQGATVAALPGAGSLAVVVDWRTATAPHASMDVVATTVSPATVAGVALSHLPGGLLVRK
jgi:hypothetical protein